MGLGRAGLLVCALALVVVSGKARPPHHTHALNAHKLEEEEEINVVTLLKPLVLALALAPASGFSTSLRPQGRGVTGYNPMVSGRVSHRAPPMHLTPTRAVGRDSLSTEGRGDTRVPWFGPLSKRGKDDVEVVRDVDPVRGEDFHDLVDQPPLEPFVDLDVLALGHIGSVLADASYQARADDTSGIERHVTKLLEDSPGTLSEGDFQIDQVLTNTEADTLMYTGEVNLGQRRLGVVAFRGTIGHLAGPNWRNNLMSQVASEDSKKANGLWESYKSLQSQALSKITEMTANEDYDQVLVVGHSLGGAMATYAAMDAIEASDDEQIADKLVVLTFGQPREYTTDAARTATEKLKKYRFVMGGDPVPAWPVTGVLQGIKKLFGKPVAQTVDFMHSGTPVFLPRAPTNMALTTSVENNFSGTNPSEILREMAKQPGALVEHHVRYPQTLGSMVVALGEVDAPFADFF